MNNPTDAEVAKAEAVVTDHVRKNIDIILERNRLYELSSDEARLPLKRFRKPGNA